MERQHTTTPYKIIKKIYINHHKNHWLVGLELGVESDHISFFQEKPKEAPKVEPPEILSLAKLSGKHNIPLQARMQQDGWKSILDAMFLLGVCTVHYVCMFAMFLIQLNFGVNVSKI